jgi:hypothetical protein
MKIAIAAIRPTVTTKTLKPRFLIFLSNASTLDKRIVVKRNAKISIKRTDDI